MFHRLIVFLAWIAALLFVLAGLMLSWEVVARYFFTRPTIWASELAQLCLIWGSLLGMSWVLATGRHISVDAVTRLCKPPVRRGLEALAMAIVALFAVVVAIKGWDIFYESLVRGRSSGSMLNLPAWVAEFPVPFGFALLTVQAMIECVAILRGKELTEGPHE
ncbi:MAG: TRAP transporter small permease [Pseudomonadota bacterium]